MITSLFDEQSLSINVINVNKGLLAIKDLIESTILVILAQHFFFNKKYF